MKIVLFYLSCFLSFTAGHMVNYSIIMYSQDVLNSNLLSGIGFGLCFGPPIILGWVAGVLCDRRAPTHLIHFGQFFFLCAVMLLGLIDRFVEVETARSPGVLASAFLAGIGWSFVSPARMASLGQVVSAQSLKKATVVFNLLVMLGFGLGPILISTLREESWNSVFWAAAGCFVTASLLLIPVRTRGLGKNQTTAFQEMKAGIQFVKTRPEIKQLMIWAIIGYSMMGPIQVLLPRLATESLGLSEMARGSLLGLLAPALIVGGILSFSVVKHPKVKSFIFGGVILAGFLFSMLGFVREHSTAVALLLGVGMSGGFALSLIVANLQAAIEDGVRGRVMGQYTLISQVMPAVSGAFAGIWAHGTSVPVALVVCGLAISGMMAMSGRSFLMGRSS